MGDEQGVFIMVGKMLTARLSPLDFVIPGNVITLPLINFGGPRFLNILAL